VNPPTSAERRDFWQHAYAHSSFLRARRSIELLLREDPPLHSPLRSALTTSIVVMYCRPFKQKTEPPIRLSEDIVPAQYKDAHDEAIEIRDKIIADRDPGKPTTRWGFINQLWVVVNGQDIRIETLSPSMENKPATKLMQLIDILVAKMQGRFEVFLQDFVRPGADGRYIVNLDENPEHWLEPWPHASPIMPTQDPHPVGKWP